MALSVSVIVPTYRPGTQWRQWLDAFARQTVRPNKALIIDSSSGDDTLELAAEYGFDSYVIPTHEFGHGRTRMLGVALTGNSDIVLLLTQDAELAAPDSIENLTALFDDPQIGAAYGRQLSRPKADPISAHARIFHYPATSCVRSIADIPTLGVKAARFSNSFGAYRRSALMQAGGFPLDAIFGEDQAVAAQMLLKGWKIGYAANAQVFHSHDYTFLQEFRRYFTIGVAHQTMPWMVEKFGSVGGEGLHFVRSELSHLWNCSPGHIPSALVRTALKLLAYRLGNTTMPLPTRMKRTLSMNPQYWDSVKPSHASVRFTLPPHTHVHSKPNSQIPTLSTPHNTRIS